MKTLSMSVGYYMRRLKVKRRQLFKSALAALASASVFPSGKKARGAGKTCSARVTPRQAQGPFYPQNPDWDAGNDLSLRDGAEDSSSVAKGLKIIIDGNVVGDNCEIIADAKIEVWQADSNGRYDHSGDPRRKSKKLDENFQYCSRFFSDPEGAFYFKTIKPGAYPASKNWVRPPHIHIKVWANGYFPLTTQIYFEPADTDLDTIDRECLKNDIVLRQLHHQGKAKKATQYLHDRDRIIRKTGESRHDVILKAQDTKDGTPVFGLTVTLQKTP